MKIIDLMLTELEREANTTRKFLSIVPFDKYDWKPHEKNMELGKLATHIAELPCWIPMTLDTKEIDFVTSTYQTRKVKNNEELLAYFEECIVEARKALQNTNEDALNEEWVMRSGDTIHEKAKKLKFIRDYFNQVTHHRAQLGVYLRVLDIPIPGSYGPSADDMSF